MNACMKHPSELNYIFLCFQYKVLFKYWKWTLVVIIALIIIGLIYYLNKNNVVKEPFATVSNPDPNLMSNYKKIKKITVIYIGNGVASYGKVAVYDLVSAVFQPRYQPSSNSSMVKGGIEYHTYDDNYSIDINSSNSYEKTYSETLVSTIESTIVSKIQYLSPSLSGNIWPNETMKSKSGIPNNLVYDTVPNYNNANYRFDISWRSCTAYGRN